MYRESTTSLSIYFTEYVGKTELASLATVSILRTQSVCYAFESNALLCVRRAHLFSRTKISLSVHWHFMTSSLTESQIRKSIVMQSFRLKTRWMATKILKSEHLTHFGEFWFDKEPSEWRAPFLQWTFFNLHPSGPGFSKKHLQQWRTWANLAKSTGANSKLRLELSPLSLIGWLNI